MPGWTSAAPTGPPPSRSPTSSPGCRTPLDSPGLGDRTLRDLVEHTVNSALRQVPEVLGSTAEIWPRTRRRGTGRSPGRARFRAGTSVTTPRTIVAELIGRATATLANVGDADVVATPIGGMRVRDWLPTRTFELVVHGMDVAAAAGVDYHLAPAVLSEAAALAARTAVAVGDGRAGAAGTDRPRRLPPGSPSL